MFIDTTKISLKAGDGGNGVVSFRQEKFVDRGGPDGGDGGKGGDVIFVADSNLDTLVDFRYKPKLTADNGGNGSKQNRHGKNGDDLIVKVPVGTVVRKATAKGNSVLPSAPNVSAGNFSKLSGDNFLRKILGESECPKMYQERCLCDD